MVVDPPFDCPPILFFARAKMLKSMKSYCLKVVFHKDIGRKAHRPRIIL